MNILCLNTAFSEAHIALEYNGKTYFESIDSNCKHSERLLVAVEDIFKKVIKTENLELNTNQILKNLNYISVVIGPGSFTGLRISIATVKAILVTNPRIKSVAINSLELIASEYLNNNKTQNNITPVIDALSGFYFIAEFNKSLNLITASKMIEQKDLKKFNNLISNDNNVTENAVKLTPENLLSLTKKKIKENKIISEEKLTPLYIRPSQAEAELCKKFKR